jgi:hypothetical protein
MHRLAAIGFAIGVLASWSAWGAAYLRVEKGPVYFNEGKGFHQVADTIEVSPGYKVMAGDGGHGWIAYPDCIAEVLPGEVITVEDHPGTTVDSKTVLPACKRKVPLYLIAAGAAVIAVGVCAAAGCFDDPGNGRKPPPKPEPRSP